MARLPNRPPSVCALSPQELSYETVDVDKVYIPTNALLIAENESIFLAIASILKDRKAVLIGGAGYIYYGKINSRLVFLLKARGEPSAVVQATTKNVSSTAVVNTIMSQHSAKVMRFRGVQFG